MARAILRRFRESPRKVRAVADMIRGRPVEDAMSILRLQQRKAAKMLSKVLGSAIANATENEKADADKLVVTNVSVPRFRPRAVIAAMIDDRGRSDRRNSRSSGP